MTNMPPCIFSDGTFNIACFCVEGRFCPCAVVILTRAETVTLFGLSVNLYLIG